MKCSLGISNFLEEIASSFPFDCFLLFLCKSPKLQLTPEQPSTGNRCLIPPKKIPHIQRQRRSPNKMVEGAKLFLETNPIPTRDPGRAQTKPCVHQDPETPQRLRQNCVWVSPEEVQVSSGLLWGQGLWVQ